MLFTICCVPVSPMRATPSHKSEMLNQLLFGECCMVMEEANDMWVKVRCRYDGYEGWCQGSHITEISEEQYAEGGNIITTGWVSGLEYDGQPMKVPLGSWLTGMNKGHASWGNHAVHYTGKEWDVTRADKTETTIRQLAFEFLNTPYLWGGKSVFGADCSGFTQTVFRFLNIPLLRDAWQQATQGEVVGFLQEARYGDLAFFDNEEGKITHVGILLNHEEIIHASGKVRVDKIDNLGIINTDSFVRTHLLRVVRRYF